MKSFMQIVTYIVAAMVLIGCQDHYEEIPAGYTGKIMTPNGWSPEQIEAGTINLGQPESQSNLHNKLVIMDNSSISSKAKMTSGS